MSLPAGTICCETCHRERAHDSAVKDGWDLVWQSWICDRCQRHAAIDEIPLASLRGGQYANGRPDPRASR